MTETTATPPVAVTLHNVWLTTEEIEADAALIDEYLADAPHYDESLDQTYIDLLAKLKAAIS